MNIRNFAVLSSMIVGLTLTGCAPAPGTASRAATAELWSESYGAIVQDLSPLWISDLQADLATLSGLETADLRTALRYLRDYPVGDLRVEWVLQRYPHYDAQSVADDFARLAQLGLVAPKSEEVWQITDQGTDLLELWMTQARHKAQAADPELNQIAVPLARILGQVVVAARDLDTGDVNDSVRWRLEHALRPEESDPPLLHLYFGIGDMIAFANDNAHHRMARYYRVLGEPEIDLHPLARELFASMREGRTYALDRCGGQTVWRVGSVRCGEAFQELEDQGWVEEAEPGVFRHTLEGAEIFASIEALTMERLYAPWAGISPDDYEAYRTGLAAIRDRANH